MDNKAIAKVISQLDAQASKLTAAIQTVPVEIKAQVVNTYQNLNNLKTQLKEVHTPNVNGALNSASKRKFEVDPNSPKTRPELAADISSTSMSSGGGKS